jgi:hypothetical protein
VSGARRNRVPKAYGQWLASLALLVDRPHFCHEVLRIAEAGIGNPFVLLVVKRYASSQRRVDLRRDRIGWHRESEPLRDHSRERHHCQLALPGLAWPAPVRELLNVAGALTIRIGPVHGTPSKTSRRN